jgi:hypothetical protein
MSNKHLIKRSAVAGRAPVTAELDYGELALNFADGKLYYKDPNGDLQFFVSGEHFVLPEDVLFNSVKLDDGTSTSVGTLSWNSDKGTVDLVMGGGAVTQEIGLQQFYQVKNQTGASIPIGTPVYVNGVVGGSGRVTVDKMVANGSILSKRFIGLTSQTILDGEDGYVTSFGYVNSLNTSGGTYGETWTIGDIIYVSQTTAGALTNQAPTSGLTLPIAVVMSVHVNNGKLLVRSGPAISATAEQGILASNSVQRTGDETIAGNKTFTGVIDIDQLTGLRIPQNASDAATKQYVDEAAEGLKSRPQVRAATTNNLTAIYSNGTNGVGSTLTATVNGALPEIDGISGWSVGNGNGILVKNQTNAAHNGRYNVTQVGDDNSPWILTRCGLCDQASEIPGSYTFVQGGTTNAGTGWVQTVTNPTTFVVGTDSVIIVQFSGAGTYTAGTGLTLTGTQFSVTATGITSGTYGSSTQIPSITVNAQGQVTSVTPITVSAVQAGDLAPVATTGSYDDLTDKPTIPSLAGYATESYVSTQLSTKQDTLVSATNIKTVNGESILGSGNVEITGGISTGKAIAMAMVFG